MTNTTDLLPADAIAPASYLSTSNGLWRAIHNAMPVCKDVSDRSEAEGYARHYKLRLSPWVWDGDRGGWLHDTTTD